MIQFFVSGIPRPGGSKRAFAFRRQDGKLGVRVVDAGTHTPSWRFAIQEAATRAMGLSEPIEDPIRLDVTFFMPRPKAHLGTKGLKEKYMHALPATRPDALKLTRALEDALTGICWHDDAQITDEHILKRYEVNRRTGVFVRIDLAPTPLVQLMPTREEQSQPQERLHLFPGVLQVQQVSAEAQA